MFTFLVRQRPRVAAVIITAAKEEVRRGQIVAKLGGGRGWKVRSNNRKSSNQEAGVIHKILIII